MKAVLFDLDGVITDTAAYHFEAWKALGTKIGIDIDEEFNEQLKGVSRTDSLNRILEKGDKRDAYSEIEKEAMATEKNDLYKTLIEKMSPSDLLPGIKVLLDELKAKNIKLGLASASKNGPTILDKLQITDYFDEVVDPAELTAGKPDPEIFLTGAKQLGVDVSECVGVEDAAAGIDSINGANMVSIGVGDSKNLGQATKVVPSTADLTVELLEKVWSETVERA